MQFKKLNNKNKIQPKSKLEKWNYLEKWLLKCHVRITGGTCFCMPMIHSGEWINIFSGIFSKNGLNANNYSQKFLQCISENIVINIVYIYKYIYI